MAEEERERLGISPEMSACIQANSDCYTAVSETLNYCLGTDVLADPQHLRLMIDAAEVCQTTQNIMLRSSELSLMLAAVCVEACETLAESCRALDGSDEQLMRCAETCDHTADSCRRLAL